MIIFSYSVETQGTLEAEWDDPSVRDLDVTEFAQPGLSGLATTKSKALELGRQELEEQIVAEYGEAISVKTVTRETGKDGNMLDLICEAFLDGRVIGAAVIRKHEVAK